MDDTDDRYRGDRYDRMLVWIQTPAGADLLRTLGASGSQGWHKPMAAALSKIISFMHDNFPMFKERRDNELRCEPLRRFLNGEDVPREDLATAILLMMQAFNGACDANWMLKKSLMERQHRQRPMPRPPMPRPMRG